MRPLIATQIGKTRVYGLLSFVLQMTSRREANRELSHPAFLATLQQLFPELESLPHADTLNRLLSELKVAHLEQAHVALLQRLIRNKKFRRYLIAQCYPIAIDGTRDTGALGPVVGGGRVGTTSGDGRRRIGAAVRLCAGSESGA